MLDAAYFNVSTQVRMFKLGKTLKFPKNLNLLQKCIDVSM